MNITEESEDYFHFKTPEKKSMFKTCNWVKGELLGNTNLEDKLKTTPSAGLTFIGKSFNIKKLWTKIKDLVD